MNHYELICIYKPDLAKVAIDKLTNSIITNLTKENRIGPGEGTVLIEKNVFDNVGKFDVYKHATFRYNRFLKKVKNADVGIHFICIDTCGSDTPYEPVKIKGNSFLDDGVGVGFISGQGCNNLSVTDNYWGSVDEATIATKVKDKNDDISFSGEIIFKPFLSEPHPYTP